MEIKPIHIPRSVIKDIPPPVVQSTEIPRPVVRGIAPPSIRVPEVIIDYPTIDVPTKEEFEGAVAPPKEEQPVQTEPNRTVSPPQPPAPPAPPVEPVETVEPAPAINVGGVDVPIPDPRTIGCCWILGSCDYCCHSRFYNCIHPTEDCC